MKDGLLLGLLTIGFVMLKLTNVIDWSWWWVLAPVWAPVATVGVFIFGYCLYKVAFP